MSAGVIVLVIVMVIAIVGGFFVFVLGEEA